MKKYIFVSSYRLRCYVRCLEIWLKSDFWSAPTNSLSVYIATLNLSERTKDLILIGIVLYIPPPDSKLWPCLWLVFYSHSHHIHINSFNFFRISISWSELWIWFPSRSPGGFELESVKNLLYYFLILYFALNFKDLALILSFYKS